MGFTKVTKSNGDEVLRPTGKGAGSTFVNLGSSAARAGIETPGEAPAPFTPAGDTTPTQAELDDAYQRMHQLRVRAHGAAYEARVAVAEVATVLFPTAAKVAFVNNTASVFDKPNLIATSVLDGNGEVLWESSGSTGTLTRDQLKALDAAVNRIGMNYDMYDRTDFPTITKNGQVQHYLRVPKLCGVDGCTQDVSQGGPAHQPSARCQSGKRPHCTCSACW